MSQIQHKSMEDKIEHYLENFEELLNKPEVDHAKLMDQMLKVVTVLMRLSAKIDKHYSLDREVDVWMHVNNVKGTFGSKAVLSLNIVGACLTIAGGVMGLASAVPGTALGNGLANTSFSFLSGTAAVEGVRLHNVSGAVGQFAQAVGMFPRIADEVNQSERTLANAHLEETKQKRQDRKESHQRHVQQHDRAIQHAREAAEKEHNTKVALIRER
jgi:hypothetical protein